MRPPVTCLVPSESPWQGGVHGLGFVAFQHVYGGKVIEFQSFYELQKLENNFTYILPVATTHGHTSYVLK